MKTKAYRVTLPLMVPSGLIVTAPTLLPSLIAAVTLLSQPPYPEVHSASLSILIGKDFTLFQKATKNTQELPI